MSQINSKTSSDQVELQNELEDEDLSVLPMKSRKKQDVQQNQQQFVQKNNSDKKKQLVMNSSENQVIPFLQEKQMISQNKELQPQNISQQSEMNLQYQQQQNQYEFQPQQQNKFSSSNLYVENQQPELQKVLFQPADPQSLQQEIKLQKSESSNINGTFYPQIQKQISQNLQSQLHPQQQEQSQSLLQQSYLLNSFANSSTELKVQESGKPQLQNPTIIEENKQSIDVVSTVYETLNTVIDSVVNREPQPNLASQKKDQVQEDVVVVAVDSSAIQKVESEKVQAGKQNQNELIEKMQEVVDNKQEQQLPNIDKSQMDYLLNQLGLEFSQKDVEKIVAKEREDLKVKYETELNIQKEKLDKEIVDREQILIQKMEQQQIDIKKEMVLQLSKNEDEKKYLKDFYEKQLLQKEEQVTSIEKVKQTLNQKNTSYSEKLKKQFLDQMQIKEKYSNEMIQNQKLLEVNNELTGANKQYQNQITDLQQKCTKIQQDLLQEKAKSQEQHQRLTEQNQTLKNELIIAKQNETNLKLDINELEKAVQKQFEATQEQIQQNEQLQTLFKDFKKKMHESFIEFKNQFSTFKFQLDPYENDAFQQSDLEAQCYTLKLIITQCSTKSNQYYESFLTLQKNNAQLEAEKQFEQELNKNNMEKIFKSQQEILALSKQIVQPIQECEMVQLSQPEKMSNSIQSGKQGEPEVQIQINKQEQLENQQEKGNQEKQLEKQDQLKVQQNAEDQAIQESKQNKMEEEAQIEEEKIANNNNKSIEVNYTSPDQVFQNMELLHIEFSNQLKSNSDLQKVQVTQEENIQSQKQQIENLIQEKEKSNQIAQEENKNLIQQIAKLEQQYKSLQKERQDLEQQLLQLQTVAGNNVMLNGNSNIQSQIPTVSKNLLISQQVQTSQHPAFNYSQIKSSQILNLNNELYFSQMNYSLNGQGIEKQQEILTKSQQYLVNQILVYKSEIQKCKASIQTLEVQKLKFEKQHLQNQINLQSQINDKKL